MIGCGCKTEECSCHSPMAGWLFGIPPFRLLGALGPDAVTEQVFPLARVKQSAGHSAADRALITRAVQSGMMIGADGAPAYIPGTAECAAAAGGGSNNLQLAQTASGLALTGASIGFAATGAALAAPLTMGISAIIGLFPMIFGHHAQAVKKEQSVLCAAVPAANNYLQIIDQAVQQGHATPQDGIHALDSLLSDFLSKVASIQHGSDPTSSGECNAACIMATQLHAIVLEKQSEYQDLIDGAAQTVAPARPNVVKAGVSTPASSYASFYGSPAAAPASSSSWLPIAALVLAGFFFLRSA